MNKDVKLSELNRRQQNNLIYYLETHLDGNRKEIKTHQDCTLKDFIVEMYKIRKNSTISWDIMHPSISVIVNKTIEATVNHNLIMRDCDRLEFAYLKKDEPFIYHLINQVKPLGCFPSVTPDDPFTWLVKEMENEGWLVEHDRSDYGLILLSRIVWGGKRMNNMKQEKKQFDANFTWLDDWRKEFYKQKCQEIDSGTIKDLNTPDGKNDAEREGMLGLLSARINQFEINSIDDILKFESLPRTLFFWGQGVNNLKPAIIKDRSENYLYGDGKKLIKVTTLNCRPLYYILCVDSGFEISEDEDVRYKQIEDDILTIIERVYNDVDDIQYQIDNDDNTLYTEEDLNFPTLSLSCGYSCSEYKKEIIHALLSEVTNNDKQG